MHPAVVVVGSLNMDFVVKTPYLPAPGETVLGHNFTISQGGKGANQAVAAARLGASVRMIGRVGQDQFGDYLRASLAGAGVDVTAVHNCKTKPTGSAFITVDDSGQNQIVVAPGANLSMQIGDVETMRRAFRGASIALFQLEIPLLTVEAAMKLAHEEGLLTMLDPAPAQRLSAEFLRHVDILTANETEFTESTIGAVPHLVRKLGAGGCQYGDAWIPAFQVDVVDTTAAGDTFNGALAVALSEGAPMREAVIFANAAAAISVTRYGAFSSAPTRAEVDGLVGAARKY